MKSAFPGFPAEGIAFLRDLKKNNDREWFTPRKNIFEETVRMPMIALVRAIHGNMLRFAPAVCWRTGQVRIPHLSRHPILERQDTV